MPESIHGQALSAKQHRMWKHVQESMRARGQGEGAAAAAATAVVKKDMAKRAAWQAACELLGVTLAANGRTLIQPPTGTKQAARPETVHALAGKLYLSQSGWLLMDVPNAVTRGLFAALNVPGAQYPEGKNGNPYNAHVSVMRKDELEKLGGGEKIEERGREFHYTLGPIQVVKPAGLPEMEKVWFVQIKSPELEALRLKYGLSALPKSGRHDFHVTFAVQPAAPARPAAVIKGIPHKAAGVRTWPQIRSEYEEKFGAAHHHLWLFCVGCGDTETCKCSRAKTQELGLCEKCAGVTGTGDANNMGFFGKLQTSGKTPPSVTSVSGTRGPSSPTPKKSDTPPPPKPDNTTGSPLTPAAPATPAPSPLGSGLNAKLNTLSSIISKGSPLGRSPVAV